MADIIDTLSGMDDAALGKKLGFNDKISSFREDLAEASKLKGKFREEVVESLTKMFMPSDYLVSDFGYKVDRMQAKAAKADNAASTDTLLQDCGCCEPYVD